MRGLHVLSLPVWVLSRDSSFLSQSIWGLVTLANLGVNVSVNVVGLYI